MGLIAKVLDIMGLDILGTTCLVTSVAFLLCASQVKFKECLQFEQSVVEKFSSFFNPLGTYCTELHSQTRLRGKSLSTK